MILLLIMIPVRSRCEVTMIDILCDIDMMILIWSSISWWIVPYKPSIWGIPIDGLHHILWHAELRSAWPVLHLRVILNQAPENLWKWCGALDTPKIPTSMEAYSLQINLEMGYVWICFIVTVDDLLELSLEFWINQLIQTGQGKGAISVFWTKNEKC